MKTATASDAAQRFAEYLDLAERGESVRFQKHGRTVARLVPDQDFMPARSVLALFKRWVPSEQDRAAANVIQEQLDQLKTKEARELADRL